MARPKIAFMASNATPAKAALAELIAAHGNAPLDKADVIVALGGDGFMLQALHATQHLSAPVYG
ncbi:MAG: NAD kinase, partial [Loktanella sp.]|nr:NAD kinase [Loktanella sp.]